MNPQLIKMEAIVNGYAEASLYVNGDISEGSGENVFIVHREAYTPPLGNSVLPGITRNRCCTSPATSASHRRTGDSARDALYR